MMQCHPLSSLCSANLCSHRPLKIYQVWLHLLDQSKKISLYPIAQFTKCLMPIDVATLNCSVKAPPIACAAYFSKVRTHSLVAAKGGPEQGLRLLGFECLPIGCYPEAPSKSPVMIDNMGKINFNIKIWNKCAHKNSPSIRNLHVMKDRVQCNVLKGKYHSIRKF